MVPDTFLCGVVLCGGASQRMGIDKALLTHPSGGTFMQFAIQRLRPVCIKILLAGRTIEIDQPEADIVGINDQAPLAGPMSGIIHALQYAASIDCQGILVTPIDMPMLSSGVLIELRNRWLQKPSLPVVAISENDQVEPLVAVYPVQALLSLKTAFAQNERSLKRWLNTNPHDTYKISAASATNVNLPDDYTRL